MNKLNQKKPISKKNVLGIVGLIVACISIISPILWDTFKNRTEITISKQYSSSLLTDNIKLSDLEVRYKGQSIVNITKSLFVIKNTGTNPILATDVISPISLAPDKGRVIDTQVEKTVPSNLVSKVIIDSNKSIVTFDLLNPGESIYVNILVDSGDIKFTPSSRVRNISKIDIIDVATRYKMPKDIDWLFIVVLMGTTFFIFGFFAFILWSNNDNASITGNLNNHEYIRNNLASKEQFVSYIERYSLTSNDNKNAFRKLKTEIEKNWSDQTMFDFAARVLSVFDTDSTSNVGPLLFSMVLGILGVYFCVRYFI